MRKLVESLLILFPYYNKTFFFFFFFPAYSLMITFSGEKESMDADKPSSQKPKKVFLLCCVHHRSYTVSSKQSQRGKKELKRIKRTTAFCGQTNP